MILINNCETFNNYKNLVKFIASHRYTSKIFKTMFTQIIQRNINTGTYSSHTQAIRSVILRLKQFFKKLRVGHEDFKI